MPPSRGAISLVFWNSWRRRRIGPPCAPEAVAEGGHHRGKVEVANWFGRLGESYEVFSPDAFFAAGDRVVVLGHETRSARPTGRRSTLDWVHVLTLCEGKLVRFDGFWDSDAAAQLWKPV